jgi:hypothetical protein
MPALPCTLLTILHPHACLQASGHQAAHGEPLEATLERVFAFLRVVKYKPPIDPWVQGGCSAQQLASAPHATAVRNKLSKAA